MCTPGKPVHSSPEITRFYTGNLLAHGNSSKGVGWKNDEAQTIRFEQLIKVIQRGSRFSINDLGCGTGRLYEYLTDGGLVPILYHGYDILPEMIAAARERLPVHKSVQLTRINSAEDMISADYVVASGIFNVKYEASDHEWLEHVLSTVVNMNRNSVRGFAFNLLTKYSDKEYMKAELYYADPCFLFDFCKTNFSRNVALLHDYNQYDFTIIVRKDI